MIDISSPDTMTLLAIRQRITESGKPAPSLDTMRAWITKGRNGVRLEAVRLGATWCTTMEAFNRFLAASSQRTPAGQGPSPVAAPAPESAAARIKRATAQAERWGL